MYADAARGEYPVTNRMSRIYDQDYSIYPNTYVNCTVHIATSGEVCQNRWPLYDSAKLGDLSDGQTALWQSEMDTL